MCVPTKGEDFRHVSVYTLRVSAQRTERSRKYPDYMYVCWQLMSCDDPAVRKLKQKVFNIIQFLDFGHISLFKEDNF